MKKLIVSMFLATLCTIGSAGYWEFVSGSSSVYNFESDNTGAVAYAGGWLNHPDWFKVGLTVPGGCTLNGSYNEDAWADGSFTWVYKWNTSSQEEPPRAVFATFYVYGSVHVQNWIDGADPALSGFNTWTYGDIVVPDPNTFYKDRYLNGQTTANQTAENYFGYSGQQQYPYLTNVVKSAVPVWDSQMTAYKVTYSFQYGRVNGQVQLTAGNNEAEAVGLSQTSYTLEPYSVGNTNFTVGEPFGGGGGGRPWMRFPSPSLSALLGLSPSMVRL